MKITLEIAKRIKFDYNYLIGTEFQVRGVNHSIKEIAILPLTKNGFGTHPINYLMDVDRQNYIKKFKDKEMGLLIYYSNNSYIPFFEFLKDRSIAIELTKYTNS
jgi:hypothetical protein